MARQVNLHFLFCSTKNKYTVDFLSQSPVDRFQPCEKLIMYWKRLYNEGAFVAKVLFLNFIYSVGFEIHLKYIVIMAKPMLKQELVPHKLAWNTS